MHDLAKLDTLHIRREDHMLSLMLDRTFDENYRDDKHRVTRSVDGVLLEVPKRATSKLAKAPVYKGSVLWNGLLLLRAALV